MARPAPGADRSVAVLELLADHPDERFTLSEVARRCGLNKATAHALLSALTAHGILLRHPDEKRYSLGPRLVAIGDAARRGYTAVDFAPPVLGRLAADTGLSATRLAAGGRRHRRDRPRGRRGHRPRTGRGARRLRPAATPAARRAVHGLGRRAVDRGVARPGRPPPRSWARRSRRCPPIRRARLRRSRWPRRSGVRLVGPPVEPTACRTTGCGVAAGRPRRAAALLAHRHRRAPPPTRWPTSRRPVFGADGRRRAGGVGRRARRPAGAASSCRAPSCSTWAPASWSPPRS